jgi:hypothetical protein
MKGGLVISNKPISLKERADGITNKETMMSIKKETMEKTMIRIKKTCRQKKAWR